jgi:hypothetical protein
MPSVIHYVPILTSVISIIFAIALFKRWRQKPSATYLAWWTLGVFMYGVGTVTESLTTLFGWHEWIFRAWYISGALLGGAPLAQGTVYLLLSKKVADRLTVVLATFAIIAAVFVLLTPINMELVEPHRLSGSVMVWRWVRLFSPFINLYAFIFLVGGAIWSAWQYWRRTSVLGSRVIGNVFIAIGALLPGIGGSFTRMGHVEVLYATEVVGIIFIWLGYQIMVSDSMISIHLAQRKSRLEAEQQ